MNLNELNKNKPPLVGLAARKAAAQASGALQKTNTTKEIYLNPAEMKDRIGIVFDDSGSMAGYGKIKDAHAGIEEFLRYCTKDQTAVTVYPLYAKPIPITANLPQVALHVKQIDALGDSTPLIKTLYKLITSNDLTRVVCFSDGHNDYDDRDETDVISLAIEKKIPIDTVFIASSANDFSGDSITKKLAESTGGVYLRFERGKTSFRTSFKYLTPTYRAMLMAPGFKEKVENGQI